MKHPSNRASRREVNKNHKASPITTRSKRPVKAGSSRRTSHSAYIMHALTNDYDGGD